MKNLEDLKIAIIHDQITQYGGAEKTLESLLDIFPHAELFAGYYKPKNISKKILSKKIHYGKVPGQLGFLMPIVFEAFDLRKYDVVISEGTAWPKGVLTNPNQLHISYIYTPPRFLYGYATEGQKRDIWYLKPFLKVLDHFLRIWDYSAAQRPDYLVSISKEVSNRVKKFYGRESTIIYPPVNIKGLETQDGGLEEGYYLCISRLAAYKRLDILIKAFNDTGLSLVIAGTGKEQEKLKALAKSNVQLLGFVTDQKKSALLTECKGFVFPTDYEDFGIVVVEALSYGKPVLCHKSGGPLEIIEDGVTGMFFSKLTPENLRQKLKEFDIKIQDGVFSADTAKKSAQKFSEERFKQEFERFVLEKWEEKQNARAA